MPLPAAADRANQILDAALGVFEAVGFDAARVEDIAAAAGVSKGAVYLHFESKAALLKALIQRHIAPVAAQSALMAQAGLDDPPATLRRILAILPTRMDNPRLFAIPRLVIAASNRFPEIAALYRAEVLDRARSALTQLVEAGVAQGRFKPIEPAVIVRALMGGVILEAMRRHVFRDPEAGVAAAMTQLTDLLTLIETEPLA